MRKTKTKKRFGRKKFCPFTADPELAMNLTYKNPQLLSRFISEDGRLIPRRTSGVSAIYQRKLTREIKRARHLALLPFTSQ